MRSPSSKRSIGVLGRRVVYFACACVCVFFFFSFLPYVEGMAIFSSSLTISNHFWYREIFTGLVFLQNDLRFRIRL